MARFGNWGQNKKPPRTIAIRRDFRYYLGS